MLIVSYKIDRDEKKSFYQKYSKVLTISAWGIVIVTLTVSMALIGLWLDGLFKTQPYFMVGLLILANITTLYRLYLESKKEIKLFPCILYINK